YVAFSGLKPGADNVFDERLTVADLGGAIFKSFRLTRQLHATPLAGAHLSIQQLETGTEGFVALGARLEGSLSYVFGLSMEHALGVTLGANIYGPATGSTDGLEPADFNLDQASGALTLGVGYQYRFATPFGSTPLI